MGPWVEGPGLAVFTGKKERAMKRKRSEPYPRRDHDYIDARQQIAPTIPPLPRTSSDAKSEAATSDEDKDLEHFLVGSLIDSYGFRRSGLLKKR